LFPSRIVLDIRKTTILNGQRPCDVCVRYQVETAFGLFLDFPSTLESNLEHLGRSKYQVGLKLNGTHHLKVYADDVNILGNNKNTIKKTQKLCDASKGVGTQVKREKTKYIITYVGVIIDGFGIGEWIY
jgi:hypothetical protein